MDYILLLLIGAVLCIIGLTNVRGSVSSSFTMMKGTVPEADVPRYGKVLGAGMLIIGLGFIAGFFLMLLNAEDPATWAICGGICLGLVIILIAQFKFVKRD